MALIDVTCPFHTEATVNLMTTVAAIAANDAIKSGFNRGHGIFRFAQNPDLDHIARFTVVAGGFEARGDDYAGVILVDNEAVQRTPPTRSSATQSARAEITRNAPIRIARAVRKGLRGFMI